ncbi:threonine ammonia-lyase [Pseudonocardiaceae bacterium YIM PH 21723]|nr:threonine ammonia-lyase [Pseudonocardiaceae bacterium YIM PH 21723]
MQKVTLDQIRTAQKTLSAIVRHTPLERSGAIDRRSGTQVFLKCENLQRTGSFKLRGAYTRIHGLSEQERACGVVAASAGNHAQGVALAAQLLGVRATVFMPMRVPLPKLAATRSYGAEVQLHGAVVDESLDAAREFAERTGAQFIHPFDHPDVIAGQGTIGLEILEQLPEVGTVVVAVGGGGLISGVATAIKALRPNVRVVGVQAEQAAVWPISLAAGKVQRLAKVHTMADGIAVAKPGELTFEYVRDLVDEVVTVSEEAISRALLMCLERTKLIVEPAGVTGLAAVLEHPKSFSGHGPIVAVLSGGNVDPLLLMQLMQHGMTAGGRYLALKVRVPDRPGSLATMLAKVAEAGANVVNIEHSRISGALALGEAEVLMNLETRGPEHRQLVVAQLRAAGFTATLAN